MRLIIIILCIFLSVCFCDQSKASDNGFMTFFKALKLMHDVDGQTEIQRTKNGNMKLIVHEPRFVVIINFFPIISQYDYDYCVNMPQNAVTTANVSYFNSKHRPLKSYILDNTTICFVQTYSFALWNAETIKKNYVHFKGFVQEADKDFIVPLDNAAKGVTLRDK